MIHVLFSKKKNKKTGKHEYRFIEVDPHNGKILGQAESHPSRQRTLTNIISKMKCYNSLRVSVVDHTTNDSRGWVKTYDLVRVVENGSKKYKKQLVYMEVPKKAWRKFE